MSTPSHESAALRWFGRAFDALDPAQKRAVEHAGHHAPLATDTNAAFSERLTFGERLADRVARFGGSWTFIIVFAAGLATWALLNTSVLAHPFDIYPFIFLNLLLSMLAAVQAPLIMMSQNRHAAKDRLDAAHDYEVNLKAELEIMALHEKLDALRSGQLALLLEKQEAQLHMLTTMVAGLEARG